MLAFSSLLRNAQKTSYAFLSRMITDIPVPRADPYGDCYHRNMVVEKTKKPKEKLPAEKLVFGQTFTDHMLEVDFEASKGWGAPKIVPFHNFDMSPATSSLHYAIQCFEGMKAYVNVNKGINLFRPEKNMDRLLLSCARLCIPAFDGTEMLECLKDLVRLDKDWIPDRRGYSLYIRPTVISTDATVGVSVPQKAKFFTILSPVGPYYKGGFAPVKLFADDFHVRACVGGSGKYKLGANYGPTIYHQRTAASYGAAQVLWLYGDQKFVSEAGTMNFFTLWVNEKGEKELITAPLDDGTILPGVVRDSVLTLCRQWGDFKVSERVYSIHELTKAVKEGRVIECFGSGTAAIVSPVNAILYQGVEYPIPLDPEDKSAGAGKLCQRVAQSIMDIQYGVVPSPWAVTL